MTSVFARAFALVIGEEGGFTDNPLDPGNWTGGRVRVGECRGTKWGIAAASHPEITNMRDLSLTEAEAIYQNEYWAKVTADSLPPSVAVTVFDAAVNSGPDRAARWLQAAAGVTVDGDVGPNTIKAATAAEAKALVTEINVRRLVFLSGLPTWGTFGLGWTRRVIRLEAQALVFDGPSTITLQTINPAPIVASLNDVRTAVREVMNEKAAA